MIERGARGRRRRWTSPGGLRALSVTVDELFDGADVAPDGAEELSPTTPRRRRDLRHRPRRHLRRRLVRASHRRPRARLRRASGSIADPEALHRLERVAPRVRARSASPRRAGPVRRRRRCARPRGLRRRGSPRVPRGGPRRAHRVRGSRAAASSQSSRRGVRRVVTLAEVRRMRALRWAAAGIGHRAAQHDRAQVTAREAGTRDRACDRRRGYRRARLDAFPVWVAPAISRVAELGADVPFVLAVCAQESALGAPARPQWRPRRRVGPDAVSQAYAVARAFPAGAGVRRWRAAGDVALRVGPPVRRRRRRGQARCWHQGASPGAGCSERGSVPAAVVNTTPRSATASMTRLSKRLAR